MTWPDAVAALPEHEAAQLLDGMSSAELEALAYDWEAWRRPSQAPPPEPWRFWLVLAGRGYGKTRVGAEMVRAWSTSGQYQAVNVIGATADDARDIMVEGESGILAICRPDERPVYVPSKRRLEWPNGCRTLIFTADEPDRLRGKQHEKLWADELASWRREGDAWAQAKLGLRLGRNPQAVITTTPKPTALLRKLVKDDHVVVTQGTTYENRQNLAPAFFEEVIAEYEGSALGRQELLGHLLAEAEGALWRRFWIDRDRLPAPPETLFRVAVGVDPPGGASECGIVAAGIGEGAAVQAHKFILADTSERLSSQQWGVKVWRTALSVSADVVVAEKNFGGDMVGDVLRSAAATAEFSGVELPRFALVTASRGKAPRAEPWATQAEQGRIHHCGEFDELEDDLCTWIPGDPKSKSPHRLDAMVWALVGAAGTRQGVYW